MQLRLKPYHKNLYQPNGLLICGETVLEWITAINDLNIDLQQVETYAVAGREANRLYGCVLFFNGRPLPKDIRNHQPLQYAGNKLLIPGQSIYLPAVEEPELKSLAPGKKILLHPAAGCVILEEQLDWSALLAFEEPAAIEPKKPLPGVSIPGTVQRFTLELSEEKLINELLNPPSEKERIANLPFDMKKLMKGNKREMEKYLKYLETHPEEALEMALPLDVLGSFRGDNKGRFSFSGSWFQGLFNSSNNYTGSGGSYTGTGGTNNVWLLVVGVVVIIKMMTCNPSVNDAGSQLKNEVVTQRHQSVLDSHYNRIMTSKQLALLQKLKLANDSGGRILNNYQQELIQIRVNGPIIKDSLKKMYTEIAKIQTDSVVKEWKKSAADSIKSIAGKADYRTRLRDATSSKKEQTYRDYALYYGVMEDNTETLETVVISQSKKQEKTRVSRNISLRSILLLSLAVIAVSLFVVSWKAPGSAGGKITVGQGELSFGRILIVLLILTGCITYILMPLVQLYGFGWLTIGICLLLIILLYRLFAKGLTLLK